MKIVLALILIMDMMTPMVLSDDKPDHHTADGFQNYPPIQSSPNLGIGFYLNRIGQSFNLPDVPENHYLSEQQAVNQFHELKDENTLTWIGQSTFLIKLNDRMILTDPFFSEYAGVFSMGPRRFARPGISSKNLPPIDIIIISHNHYDHLDAEFVETLPNKKNIHVFVPLKLKSFFTERGYIHVHELDWNESFSIDNILITALPALHYSGRGLSDKNETLWCSWSINSPSGKYYFSGDTAYSPTIFKKIGQQFNSFDLAVLTIGTYGNRKYGVNNHLTPEEAINVGIEIQAGILVGMHWGTIEMSDESPWEPPIRFREAGDKAGISSQQTWLMKIGETRILPGLNRNQDSSADN